MNHNRISTSTEPKQTSTIYSAWPIEKCKLVEFLNSPGNYAIEIGSFAGGTSRVLGTACRTLGKTLVCIDPWENDFEKRFPRYLDAIADINDSVITIKEKSHLALSSLPDDLPGNVCLVFVDGDHIYPEPLYDMQRYWPLLAEGGVMAIHDIFDAWWHAGIFRSITEFFMDKPGYCLEAINFIPSLEEAMEAQHHSSGLIWTHKGNKLIGYDKLT